MFIKPTLRRKAAFTLTEMMVTIAVGSMLLSAVVMTNIFFGRNLSAIYNYYDLDYASRHALDIITSDIRGAQGVSDWTTNSITFKTTNGLSFQYSYQPQTKKLIKVDTNFVQTVLLTNCTAIPNKYIFAVYQRNTTNDTFDNYQPSSNNFYTTVKVVQINWTCARDVIGVGQTESVQTAKVVIRNQQATQ